MSRTSDKRPSHESSGQVAMYLQLVVLQSHYGPNNIIFTENADAHN